MTTLRNVFECAVDAEKNAITNCDCEPDAKPYCAHQKAATLAYNVIEAIGELLDAEDALKAQQLRDQICESEERARFCEVRASSERWCEGTWLELAGDFRKHVAESKAQLRDLERSTKLPDGWRVIDGGKRS